MVFFFFLLLTLRINHVKQKIKREQNMYVVKLDMRTLKSNGYVKLKIVSVWNVLF